MSEDVVAVFIPIIAIFMSLLIPIVYAIVDYRRRKDVVEAHHRERLAAIERGTDIPPLPDSFYNPWQRNRRPRTLLTGMIWFFVGIGLFIALGKVAGDDVQVLRPDPGRRGPRVPDLLRDRGPQGARGRRCHGPIGCLGAQRLTGTPGLPVRPSATGLAQRAWRDQDRRRRHADPTSAAGV